MDEWVLEILTAVIMTVVERCFGILACKQTSKHLQLSGGGNSSRNESKNSDSKLESDHLNVKYYVLNLECERDTVAKAEVEFEMI